MQHGEIVVCFGSRLVAVPAQAATARKNLSREIVQVALKYFAVQRQLGSNRARILCQVSYASPFATPVLPLSPRARYGTRTRLDVPMATERETGGYGSCGRGRAPVRTHSPAIGTRSWPKAICS
jgi:hypothetical protein